jgi:hypothetical protein
LEGISLPVAPSKYAYIYPYIHTHTHTQTDRQTERERERERCIFIIYDSAKPKLSTLNPTA